MSMILRVSILLIFSWAIIARLCHTHNNDNTCYLSHARLHKLIHRHLTSNQIISIVAIDIPYYVNSISIRDAKHDKT